MAHGFSDKGAGRDIEGRKTSEEHLLEKVEDLVRGAKSPADLVGTLRTYQAALTQGIGAGASEMLDALKRNFGNNVADALQKHFDEKDPTKREILTRKSALRGKVWAFDNLPADGDEVFIEGQGKVRIRGGIKIGSPFGFQATEFGGKDGTSTKISGFWGEPSVDKKKWVLVVQTESGNTYKIIRSESSDDTVPRFS